MTLFYEGSREFVDRSCAKISAEGAKSLAPTDVTNRTLKISFEAEFGVVFLHVSNEEKFQSWGIRSGMRLFGQVWRVTSWRIGIFFFWMDQVVITK